MYGFRNRTCVHWVPRDYVDVVKLFSHYWPFVRKINTSVTKGQRCWPLVIIVNMIFDKQSSFWCFGHIYVYVTSKWCLDCQFAERHNAKLSWNPCRIVSPLCDEASCDCITWCKRTTEHSFDVSLTSSWIATELVHWIICTHTPLPPL